MKRKLTTTLIAFLAMAVLMSIALSSTHKVEIMRAATVNGVELKPGNYRLSVADENTAEIYKGSKLIVKAKVEILPLGGATPGSVTQGIDGKVREIRLKNEKVVFLDAASAASSGGR
jgi:hypothetical protein